MGKLRNLILCRLALVWILSCTYGFVITAQETDIRINEFMALNETTITDKDGDNSDWIELYNSSFAGISLSGWSLTDEKEVPDKWILPDITLPSNGYLLIFASGKNISTPGNELHTNFKLSGAGEYLALIDPEGTIVTEFDPAFPAQQTDISFGYYNGSYISFISPTPGTENLLSGAILPDPVFSVDHRVFDTPFNLELTATVTGASIYYTVDGSTPDKETGIYYRFPIPISTTTVIRAITTLDDQTPSNVITRSYIRLSDVVNQPNNPSGYPAEWGPWTYSAGRALADYEMDPEVISGSGESTVIEALASLPVMSLVSDIGNFFNYSTDPSTGGIYMYPAPDQADIGRGWERPASIEYFSQDGAEGFQVNCGLEIHGGESRRPEKSPKHSLRLLFKSEYGPSRLNFPLFGEEAVSSFNTLVLRAGFNNSWIHWSNAERPRAQYIQDIWMKDTQRAMGHPSSQSIYVHLFINGLYWGIYAPSEKLNAEFAESYLGGSAVDYDVIKDYQEVADGTIDAWNTMVSMANAGLVDNESYQKIQGNNPDGSPNPGYESMVDVVNLADYMLLNLYAGNTDWDHHNWTAMRNRVEPGTGFRFLCWDAEHVMENINQNVVSENNPNCPSRVFQQLMQNPDFRVLFGDRVQRFCFNGGLLTPEAIVGRWSVRRDQVEAAIPAESARWGDYRRDVHPYQSGPYELYTYENHWLAQQSFLLNDYFPARTGVLINQLRAAGFYSEVDAPAFMINNQPVEGTTVSRGDILSMSSSEGIIYYTSNGTDPAVREEQDEQTTTTFIPESADKRVLVPHNDLGTGWYTDVDFTDDSWLTCTGLPGGAGYEKGTGIEDYISLDLGALMHDDGGYPNPSCYIRIPFIVEQDELDGINFLYLDMLYDDGFIVWLNGSLILSVNAPASPAYNSTSTAQHEANGIETFDLSDYKDLLSAGNNLLAIQGLNANTSSSDFIILPKLYGTSMVQASISPDAVMYTGPVDLDLSQHILARTYLNGSWSALSDRFFIIPEDLHDIKITEVHYHPLELDTINESDLEFIELKNTGEATLDIGGVKFVDGIDYVFPPETQFNGGEFIVLASDVKGFEIRYGFEPFDEYNGRLDNGGEWIILASADDDTLCAFHYDDDPPWPASPDGLGPSLVPMEKDPTGDQNSPDQWYHSFYSGGSPGTDDSIVITVIQEEVQQPEILLSQNYPNPFSDLTYINYIIPGEAFVEISVYNLVGQKVITLVSGNYPEGSYVISWNGTDYSGNSLDNGIYFYRMIMRSKTNTDILSGKMILLH